MIQEAIDDPPPVSLSSDESMVYNPLAQSTTEVDKFKNNYLFDGTFYKVLDLLEPNLYHTPILKLLKKNLSFFYLDKKVSIFIFV